MASRRRGELAVRILADTRSARKDLRGLGQESQKSSRVIGAAFGAAAVGVGALTAAIGVSIAAAGEFQAGLAEVGTLSAEAAMLTDEYGAGLKRLAAESGQTHADLTRGLYNTVSAGVAAGDALGFLDQSTKLATAGVTDVNTAVDILTTATNAWSATNLEAGRANDIIFATVQRGKTTVEEFGRSLFQAAPLAAKLNVGLDEVGATVATLTAQGVPTAQAMTQLRGAMQGLTRPTTELTELFNRAGYASGQAAIEALGFGGAADILANAVDGDIGQLTKLVGSIEGVQAILGITGDQQAAFSANLEATRESSGVAERAYNRMANTFEFQRRRLEQGFNNIKITIGEAFLPVVSGLIRFILDDAIPAFRDWAAEVEQSTVFQTLKSAAEEAREFILLLFNDPGEAFRRIAEWWKGIFAPQEIETAAGQIETVTILDRMSGTFDALFDALQKHVIAEDGPVRRFVGAMIDDLKASIQAASEHGETIRAVGSALLTIIVAGIGTIKTVTIATRLAGLILRSIVTAGSFITAAALSPVALAIVIGILAALTAYDAIPEFREWVDGLIADLAVLWEESDNWDKVAAAVTVGLSAALVVAGGSALKTAAAGLAARLAAAISSYIITTLWFTPIGNAILAGFASAVAAIGPGLILAGIAVAVFLVAGFLVNLQDSEGDVQEAILKTFLDPLGTLKRLQEESLGEIEEGWKNHNEVVKEENDISFKTLGAAFGTFWDRLISGWEGGYFERVGALLAERLPQIESDFDLSFANLNAAADTFWNDHVLKWEIGGVNISDVAAGTWMGLQMSWQSGTASLGSIVEAWYRGDFSGLQIHFGNIKNATSSFWNDQVLEWSIGGVSLRNVASSTWSGLQSIWNAGAAVVGRVVLMFRLRLEREFRALQSGVLSIWNGIKSGIEAAVNFISRLVSRAISGAARARAAVDRARRAVADVPVVGGIVNAAVGNLPSFQRGGVVPGPVGQPVPAIVHGGEEVLTPEQRRQRQEPVQIDVRIELDGRPLDARILAVQGANQTNRPSFRFA